MTTTPRPRWSSARSTCWSMEQPVPREVDHRTHRRPRDRNHRRRTQGRRERHRWRSPARTPGQQRGGQQQQRGPRIL